MHAPTLTTRPRAALRPLAAAAFLLLWACASAPKEERDVRWLVDHRRYEDAVRVAAEEAARRPGDEQAQALHREATVAWWLEQGRRKTFEDDDLGALEDFQEALRIDPQSEIAADWIVKTRHKVGLRELSLGLELHANDQIPEALEHYEKALAQDPELQGARVGRQITLLILQYRAGLGGRYFKEGLKAVSDYWLELAHSRFAYAEKYEHGDQRPAERKTQVRRLLAVQRLAAGRAYQDEGRFGAATGEYRMAVSLDPESADAKAALEKARVELEVYEQLQRARFEIVRGRLEKAQELIEKALARTDLQKEQAEGVLAELREARFEGAYKDALALERDWRFEEAAARYDELLAEAQFYKDAIARRDTLREYVRRAAELYERAGAETSPAEQLALLRQIELFWPEYRDIHARIQALQQPPAAERP